MVRWVVYLFLGSTLNLLTLRLFGEWFTLYFSTSYPYTLDLLLAILQLVTIPTLVFAVPILLSLMFTRFHPEKRLVPPLYIQIVTWGMFILVSYSFTFSFGVLLVVLAIYASLGGLTQDRIVVSITGLSADRDCVVCRAFEVASEPEKLVQILTRFKYLGVENKSQRKADGTIVLRSPKSHDYTTVMEIKQGAQPNESLLTVAFYEIGRYRLLRTEDLEEYAEIRTAYLRSVLSRDEYRIGLRDGPVNLTDPLIDSIVDECQGRLTANVKRMSKLAWLKLLAFASAVAVVALFLFYMKNYAEGFATLAIVLLYLAFDLPSRLRRD